jgi:hypothetical protein
LKEEPFRRDLEELTFENKSKLSAKSLVSPCLWEVFRRFVDGTWSNANGSIPESRECSKTLEISPLSSPLSSMFERGQKRRWLENLIFRPECLQNF